MMATLRRPKIIKRLSWQDMSPSSPKIRLTRRIVQLEGEKVSADILKQAKTICNDYIEGKLERDGIKNRSLSNKFSNSSTEDSSQKTSEVSQRIQEIGELLEHGYPGLYRDISGHVNISFSSENAVHDVFNNVSSEILTDGLNWGRIVALYAFAGALVSECCREGRNSFVFDIGNWMYEFAALHLVEWIKSKGGWEDILRAFPRPTTPHGFSLIISEVSRWSSYLLVTARNWFESGFELVGHLYKAYLRKMPNYYRKRSR